jgi:hypothetical protein
VSGVPFTKRDMWDGQYEWLWCVHPAGDAGWVPAEWLVVDGDYATAQHDYHAIELTVSADEIVAVHKTVAGWYWCENQDGQLDGCLCLALIPRHFKQMSSFRDTR